MTKLKLGSTVVGSELCLVDDVVQFLLSVHNAFELFPSWWEWYVVLRGPDCTGHRISGSEDLERFSSGLFLFALVADDLELDLGFVGSCLPMFILCLSLLSLHYESIPNA